MGKRTRSGSDDYECIAQKIKKLQEDLARVRRKDKRKRKQRTLSSSSSDTSSSASRSSRNSRSSSPDRRPSFPALPQPKGMPSSAMDCGTTEATTAGSTTTAAQPSTSAAALYPQPLNSGTLPSTSSGIEPTPLEPSGSYQLPPDVEDPPPELDEELLQILGEDPSQARTYGKDIQSDLAVRLQHIATSGLSREVRKELLEKYLPPTNCMLIDAPTSNPEAVYAITDVVLKRDKGLELRQKQRAAATACVAEALTLLMSTEPRNTVLIQLLMDASKLICDSQATDSIIRRNFILNGLKKDLKDQLQSTKIDKLLFGEKLAETLKAAKAISRTGADLKPAPLKNQPPKKTSQNLNWRRPPPSQRPQGTQRTKEPSARRNRHENISRRSSRPAKDHSRNRR